jgi:signal peptidase
MSRNVYVIFASFLIVYLVLNLVSPGGLMAYILPSVCWAALALLTLYVVGLKRILSWINNRLALMALLAAVFQIFILMDAGLTNKFGNSPMSFEPIGIGINFMMVSSTLLGMELSRGYLVKNLRTRNPTLAVAAVTLMYTFANVSIFMLVDFNNPLIYTKFMGQSFLPALTENLLATYLALISGPTASLAYRAPLQAFQWFSPILPDLSWGYQSIIGVMAPTVGFITINAATTLTDQRKAGLPTQRKPRSGVHKSQSSMKGWLAVSVLLVLIVWSSTGLLGFYPTIVASGSMQPTLSVGDIAIVVSADPDKVQVGDVIQYWQKEEMILHRIVESQQTADGMVFITKGDANNAPDPDPVLPSQIVGKLVLKVPQLGWVSIALKEVAADAYAALATNPSEALANAWTWTTTNGVYLTSVLTLAAWSCLLLTYKKKIKSGKNQNE